MGVGDSLPEHASDHGSILRSTVNVVSAGAVSRRCLERELWTPVVGWTTATLLSGGGGGRVGAVIIAGTERNAVAVPLSVVLHYHHHVIAVRVHKLRPRLPQRVHDIVDETHLYKHIAIFHFRSTTVSFACT